MRSRYRSVGVLCVTLALGAGCDFDPQAVVQAGLNKFAETFAERFVETVLLPTTDPPSMGGGNDGENEGSATDG